MDFPLRIVGDSLYACDPVFMAMGLDNDCTAVTAGSIIGAIVGKKGTPEHWRNKFNK